MAYVFPLLSPEVRLWWQGARTNIHLEHLVTIRAPAVSFRLLIPERNHTTVSHTHTANCV